MTTVTDESAELVELREALKDAERECRSLQNEVDDLERANRRLEGELDEALDAAGVSEELRAVAEAIDMIAAGDMSGALHTIRRACHDAKVQDACDRAFSKLNCLVPA